MGGIHRSSYVKVYIRRFLKQKSADKRSAVLLKVPILIKLVVPKIILSILNYLVHSDNALGDKVSAVRFTATLKNRPACLSSEGEVSAEMEKVLNKMPGAQGDAIKAKMVLGINREHPVAEVLKGLVGRDDEKLRSYAKLLYAQARLIGGMSVEDPGETCELITALMV